jgi:hypothetical protein
MAGRPALYNIYEETITTERLRGYSWILIANKIGVPNQQLYRWRKNNGYVDPLRSVGDDELSQIIRDYLNEHPFIGRIFLAGHLLSEKLFVPLTQLRRVTELVDPEGLTHRKTGQRLKRREYNIVRPHHLWHIDGHHALDRWGLVTHGAIDGASRVVLYLHCADNNLPATPLEQFVIACHTYQIPRCVR